MTDANETASLTCDVAIVGAGPTGLTIAHLLGQAGLRVLLIERNASTVAQPRAVSIDDEALRTMQAIELADEVIADVMLDYGSNYFTPNGVCFAKVEPTTREYGYPRRNAFTQPRLEATLRAALARYPHVEPLFEHDCESVVEDEAGVSLTLRAGAQEKQVRAAYVVGSDGARSKLRQIIGATLEGSTYRQRWLIVDLAETKERFRQTRVMCDPARPFITLPGPGGIRRYEFMLHENENEEASSTPEFARSLLAAAGPDADSPVVRRQVYTFHARKADRWNSKRIYLAGDAAHLSPPFAGQGMNSGIRDAHNLAWKLAAVVKGAAGAGLLTTYQQERSPHAWALIELAMNMGRIMMPKSLRQAAFVQNAFRAASLVPPVQAYFAQMKYKPKPFYRDGFLADDGGLALSGRMLAQPWLERRDRSRMRLDDAAGHGFAIVAIGPEAQAVAAQVDAEALGLGPLPRIAVVPQKMNLAPRVDEDVVAGRDLDNLFGPLAPAGDILVLLRPDRYVAVATKIGGSQTPGTFVELCRRLMAATRL
ncbi:MAG: bifunctional 3-(3-hydroxy-phenyl)propionate/3-hydroxycinnamic acid hydroxylase [Beijerinckiaceae bacterium]|nr:bifunctional 3-(3-hydroxy-phenyl)propionate/3-hydroxycinnamic acid hydroxylase [Beijerinckiaceae bacterium]